MRYFSEPGSRRVGIAQKLSDAVPGLRNKACAKLLARECRGASYSAATRNCLGYSSQVRPLRMRPDFFLFTPPHCLKKKAVLYFSQFS